MISGLALRFLCHSASAVGGQAVMEGVMIRAENRLAIAGASPTEPSRSRTGPGSA
jgi:hypothetical protein